MCLSWRWRRGSQVRSSCWDVFGHSEVISRSRRSLFLSLLWFLKKRHYTPYYAPYYRRQRHCFSYWWNTNIVFALNKSGEEKEVSSGISPAARDYLFLNGRVKTLVLCICPEDGSACCSLGHRLRLAHQHSARHLSETCSCLRVLMMGWRADGCPVHGHLGAACKAKRWLGALLCTLKSAGWTEQSRPLLFVKQYSYTYQDQFSLNLRDEMLFWSRQTNPPSSLGSSLCIVWNGQG